MVLLGFWKLAGAQARPADPPIEKQTRVKVAMRDGVRLETNVFHPQGFGKWPAILIRTPYGKGADISANQRAFVDHGYAMVIQDVRGRGESEGRFQPMTQEGADGEDTIAWIARQPWCDGKVGMMGASYLGFVQWQAALRNPPALKAIFPGNAGYDDYLDRYYSRGGAYKLGHRLVWMAENQRDPSLPKPDFGELLRRLPLREADRAAAGKTVDWFQRVLDHPSYDSFWKDFSTREKIDRMRIPVYSVAGWFDNYAQSDLEAFGDLHHRGREARLLLGPWPHNMNDRFTTVDFGADSLVPLRSPQFLWFDHWLKGKDTIGGIPPMRYFTMGENKWHETSVWPPPNVSVVPYYLAGKGNANGASSDGTLQLRRARGDRPEAFTYDPRNPVPTRGGAICCDFKILPPGPMDQRPVESRSDVLLFTGEPLKKDLEVTGTVRAVIYVSTSAPDTDFTAKLVDVWPNGAAMSVTDGILRLRYRGGLDKPELAKANQVYGVTIDAGVTSIVFRAGHRLRLEISSSNFPRFDRNPNTGRPVADERELRVAHQTVHHGAKYPSALMLPVVRRK